MPYLESQLNVLYCPFSLQGYPLELLSITVSGVPSMHICLDFAPELLSQPDLEKQVNSETPSVRHSCFKFSAFAQVFAIDLISHLSVQYALPKSFSTARLAVNALSTLLSGN
jgi:integrator complex subunit 2